MTYRVVAADPRLHLVIESGTDDFRARTDYAIDPFVSGSRVAVTSVAEPVRWLHRITAALARRAYSRQFEAMLEARMLPMLALAERIQRA